MYVGKKPFVSTSYTTIMNKLSDGDGEWLFIDAGNNTTAKTYSMELEPDTEYYMSVCYSRYYSTDSYQKTIVIKGIQFESCQ